MPFPESRLPSGLLRSSADILVATSAGGLVLLLFYPLTLCAAGVKGLLRKLRPYPVSHRAANLH
jgi:hypothetical protein